MPADHDEFEPPDWLVSAMADAFLGGEFPAFISEDEVRASGVLQAMHGLGVRFSQAPLSGSQEAPDA